LALRLLYTMALLPAALFFPGCVAAGPDNDISPLLRSAFNDATEEKETELFVPFFAAAETPEEKGWALRPLIGLRRNRTAGITECDFLPPFGRYFSHNDRCFFRFWPLYSYTKMTREEGDDVDWTLFPILFGGHSAGGENYFAIFPLGGRIRNFLSYDSFDFALWPLYQRVTKTVFDPPRRSTSFLLLFGWTSGGPTDGSCHVLPFYMKSAWKGKYNKYSLLWPFFHYQEKGLNTSHPAKVHAFWPLAHVERADNYHRYGLIGPILLMPPLIQFAREIPDHWQGKPNVKKKAYYLYDLPWPLVHVEKTREYERFRLFPFYSHFHEERSGASFDSKCFLIPFFWLRNSRTVEYRKSDFFFVPLVTRINKMYSGGGGEDSYFQLWPLFHSDSTRQGGEDFSFLSLMPSRVAPFLKPVERLAWPFWSLYRYQRDPAGAVRHRFLFSLISSYRDETESRFSIPLLYNYTSAGGGDWEHNFLWKLISVDGDGDGLKNVRFLFIPVVSTTERRLRGTTPQTSDP
jgi:hypothetical protein